MFKNYQLLDTNTHWFKLVVFLPKHRDCGGFYVSAPSCSLRLACPSLEDPIPTLLTSELATQLPLATVDYSRHYAFSEVGYVPWWGVGYRGTSRKVIFKKPGVCYQTSRHVQGQASSQEEDTAFPSNFHALVPPAQDKRVGNSSRLKNILIHPHQVDEFTSGLKQDYPSPQITSSQIRAKSRLIASGNGFHVETQKPRDGILGIPRTKCVRGTRTLLNCETFLDFQGTQVCCVTEFCYLPSSAKITTVHANDANQLTSNS